MPRRRFTTEELEAMAVEKRLTEANRHSILKEFGSWIHRGVLLFMCTLKRNEAKEDLTRDLKLPSPHRERDRLLRTRDAAPMLGVARQYFGDHESELPFVIRLPNGALRISEQGLLRWIEQQQGGGEQCHEDQETSIDEEELGTGGSDTASRASRNTRAPGRRRNPRQRDS